MFPGFSSFRKIQNCINLYVPVVLMQDFTTSVHLLDARKILERQTTQRVLGLVTLVNIQ